MAEVSSEPEYETDPEDALLPSAMRRRVASDDEDEERIDTEEESDGQGGAPVEDDVEDDEDSDDVEGDDVEGDYVERIAVENVELVEEVVGEGEEKKENEPFAVPTAGAFYMHDDRFRDSAGGRQGRLKGGRRLWESKDEGQWVHDRFEALSIQDSRQKGRNARGRLRGRGGSQSSDHGRGIRDSRGNKSNTYTERSRGSDGRSRAYMDERLRVHDEDGHQNQSPKFFKGRGSRRYEPLPKGNNEKSTSHNKPSGKPNDVAYGNNEVKKTSSSSNIHSEHDHAQRQILNSSLNSASPPFYPSGSSSSQELHATSKREVHAGLTSRGRTVADHQVKDRYVADHMGQPSSTKNMRYFQPPPTSSVGISDTHVAQRDHGRGFTASQLGKSSAQMQFSSGQRPGQAFVQAAQRVNNQSGGQVASTSSRQMASSSEVGDADSPRGSVKSAVAGSGKSKVAAHGGSRGGFVFGGAQVMGTGGAIGLAHGDQNFPGTPALLPVMQFGGQRPGVPTVGMALPGYVAQPNMGFGNSEMTWLPVLAGAGGALGGSYAQYLTLDGNYYACSPAQTSSSTPSSSSRDTAVLKPSNSWKNSQKPETSNDVFGQRQNKPRRYSEMNFSQ